MSRVAKNPISIPDSVKVALSGSKVEIKGSKTTLNYDLHDAVVMTVEGNVATFGIKDGVSG
ncbi:MAG: 50S ribosomal protein L6, partial [Gammaproteobacteria bacterium]|nr:50S ribosomal protein L6 [Gammaproteobacteria bacterium]